MDVGQSVRAHQHERRHAERRGGDDERDNADRDAAAATLALRCDRARNRDQGDADRAVGRPAQQHEAHAKRPCAEPVARARNERRERARDREPKCERRERRHVAEPVPGSFASGDGATTSVWLSM